MNRFFSVLGLCLLLIISSCAQKKNKNNQRASSDNETTQDSLPPVETKEPNIDYEPAFEGQTRAPGMKTETSYEGKILTKDLSAPWGITPLPDGRLLITQNKGSMVIATTEGDLSDPIEDGIPDVNPSGQGGLLGLTLDPDFENNKMVYWAFSEKSDKGNLTAVAKGKLADDEKSFEDTEVIFRATPAYDGDLHYGGRVIFDKEGNLFLSTGERSDLETRPQAQELNSALGKIIRITKDGDPVAGNPFEDNEDYMAEIWSYGHRNVQGLAWNPVTGDLWNSEFGPRGGDEINLIEPGKNYGWPVIGYGIEYSGEIIGEGITQKEGMEQPVYYWDPVLSPSGMTFYEGDNIPEWKNNLFVGGLNGNHIARLKIEDNKVTGEERILEDEGERFRDITQGKDGDLYTVTDDGRLYRLYRK